MTPKPVLKRILVPLDGSAEAEAILPYLPGLLAKTSSEVVLMQAVPFLATLLSMPEAFSSDAPLAESDLASSRRYLDGIVAALKDQGVSARGIVRIGAGAETILDIAREERVTLIALSTHAHSRMSHLLHASVPERTLRRSQTPFFIVHAPPKGLDLIPRRASPSVSSYKDILVPLGSEETTLAILPYVLRFARRFGSSIRFLHVVEPEEGRTGPQALLRWASAQCARESVPCEEILRRGDVGTEILEAARVYPTDLIAMSTHGLPPVKVQGPLGHVAGALLDRARVPMLVARGSPVAMEAVPSAADPGTANARILRS